MPRISLIGPGAIGGLAAGWLCQDERNDVTLCARTPLVDLRLHTPYGPIEAHPKIQTEPGTGPAADWILVATKAYDSGSAAAWFAGIMGEGTRVAVLQNGVDHVERFSAYLPADRIVPVIVDCPTERIEPGVIRQRGDATMVVPESAIASEFTKLFAKTKIDASASSDFTTIAWRKLCINSAGAVNALLLKPEGIVRDPHAANVMRKLILETAAVGRAEGARLDDSIADEVCEIFRSHPADTVNSLHADRLAGRPMEVDLRNGVVVRLGQRHGISTPCNEMVVALLKAGT